MHSILTLRKDYYSAVAETLNLSARGISEAENIAGIYAESKDYGYWQLNFHRYEESAPKLIRSKNNSLRVDYSILNRIKGSK